MSFKTKQVIIGLLGGLFLLSLVFVQWMEVARKRVEAGLGDALLAVPASSKGCVDCHAQLTPGIIDHWEGSTHAEKGVGCVECHQAEAADVDAFAHYGHSIATVVTPLDCGRCHPQVFDEFSRSHHAAAGNILASLDNTLAEVVEGHRGRFNPHAPTPGRDFKDVNGMASVASGCQQCHGSKVALLANDGGQITVDDLKPNAAGQPTNLEAVGRISRTADGRPQLHASTWPNTGIGRLNLDGSRGSCSACHSRHDFSPRRARRPENCGKCHLGPDHPQKEIYEESKHGVAYRDMEDEMNLDADEWVLGKDYTAAPTCASCHMSGNIRNGGRITHDPGERISWTNRPPISLAMDTDIHHQVVKDTDPEKRAALVDDSWQDKRARMREVCTSCHTTGYVDGFYKQYDEFVVLYNEKFARPGQKLMDEMRKQGLITKLDFDEPVEWSWYLLWHHEGRRARHGASMMAPDYTHWHGMFEVAERFYQHFVPEIQEICDQAEAAGKGDEAAAVRKLLREILSRPEHQWNPTILQGHNAAARAQKGDKK